VSFVLLLFHKYDKPPSAINVALLPSHTVVSSVNAVIAGLGLTFTVIADVEEHPFASVPVTVYVVVEVGVTISVEAVPPELHA
jgi:hypothetical protein